MAQLRHLLDTQIWCTPTLIVGDLVLLFDAGPPTFPTGTLWPYLAEHDIAPEAIGLVVSSHCHWDHVGGNAEVSARTGARFLAHHADADFIRDPAGIVRAHTERFGDLYPAPQRIEDLFGRPRPPDGHVDDGQVLDLGSRRLTVLHTPGHTWGHVCLWEEDEGTLFAADAVEGRGTAIAGPEPGGTGLPMYSDVGAYRATAALLRRKDPDVMLLGHPFEPLSTSVIVGSAVRRFLDATLAVTEEIDDLILAGCRPRPASLTDLATLVVSALGSPAVTFPALVTIDSHLRHLAHGGLLERMETERGLVVWRRTA